MTEWTELTTEIVDRGVYDRAVRHLRQARVVLPTFAQLSDPRKIPAAVSAQLDQVDPDAAHAANLFRVHWHNDAARRGTAPVPIYLDLPEALTGVKARILVALARHFPMISAHKVLAAYGCLAPRIVTGQFDPERQKAVWPSTGNYCRGGVAISRILDCRGVAILPEGMSRERFDWLQRWVRSPDDIVRTPGTESNVKEIYDACHAMARDPANVILNQFSEFGNYLAHYVCTGPALRAVFEEAQTRDRGLRLSAFVAASGSAGTLGAGDYLKTELGAKIVAVEAVECPTMLYNGYGEHNIQGIGDKHIPFIHNVMNTDVVVGISDRSTDALNLLLNSDIGKRYLAQRQHLDPALVQRLDGLGLSSIANVLAAIKTAKRLGLGSEDAIVTVATDGAAMYGSEREKYAAGHYPGGFAEVDAGEIFGAHLQAVTDDHVIELSHIDRERIFNLGYYTWVEQQGVPLADFDRRRDQRLWRGFQAAVPRWDALIEQFNAEAGVNRPG
ncbi:MAG TPA: pyridoxal-phosphate dependent enzyme [Stellaceae bacterium]|nr:pyridoxal-phosphate dependent enzyme [Stellaceae bacterium]